MQKQLSWIINTLSFTDGMYDVLGVDAFNPQDIENKLKEYDFGDDEIATGIQLKIDATPNEIDVVFIYQHKLFIIECKTSIIEKRKIKRIRKGEEVEEKEDIKLLPEIIYKSDALRNSFGLFSNTGIRKICRAHTRRIYFCFCIG